MQYEENDPRQQRHRERPHQHRPERPQRYQEEHFNDFRSRWGNPAPIFSPRQDEWRPRGGNRFGGDRPPPPHREEWLPQQRRQHRNQRPQERNEQRPPVWRQQDVHFHSSNQHANDRWQYDHYMPYPNYRHERQLPPDDYWDERLR